MSRVIARLPSTLDDEDELDDENRDKTVFTDEGISIFPCYNHYPKKNTRLSVSGNSARLKSINLNEYLKKEVDGPPIRRIGARSFEDPFKKYKVPDEVVDVIFSNLRKRDLLAAMLVSRSFHKIGNESKNWLTTDVMDRPVTELSLVTLMKRKIRVLRLAGAKPDPISRVNIRLYANSMQNVCRLEFLDLSRANLTDRQLHIVLKPCRKLRCLSIEGNVIDNEVANCIANNKSLIELDISMTRGINVASAKLITQNCKNLEQLNASWCGLDTPILDVIVESITRNIRKLNLAGSVRNFGMANEHIDNLLSRADKMIDLDLSDNAELSDAAVATIIAHYPKLMYLSINRCYGIDPNVIVHLNSKPTLRYLNVHGCITEANMEIFLQMCGRLRINSQLFNFTAKPVTNNAPSIWGNSMLDK